MFKSALVALLGLVSFASGFHFTPAPVITDNIDAAYKATLLNSSSSTIRGTVTASSTGNGSGLSLSVFFTGLPPDVGPFPYHVHLFPVPRSGDCQAAGLHLDPYNRGEMPPCDPSDPATCQLGDLSGKHGPATSTEFTAHYMDPYLSNNPGSKAFLGDRSIVIHAANGTRLNCGNFQLIGSGRKA